MTPMWPHEFFNGSYLNLADVNKDTGKTTIWKFETQQKRDSQLHQMEAKEYRANTKQLTRTNNR